MSKKLRKISVGALSEMIKKARVAIYDLFIFLDTKKCWVRARLLGCYRVQSDCK
jgi:hypothetical protein